MAKSVHRRSSKRHSRKNAKKVQRGGNYYLNVGSERIGGMAEVINVNDPIKPLQGASSGEFATPLFMMSGGAKKGKKSSNKMSSKKSSKKMMKKKSSNKSYKKSSKKMSKKRVQKGGAELASAPYNGNGMESVFHDNMMERDFSCHGPEWMPKCI